MLICSYTPHIFEVGFEATSAVNKGFLAHLGERKHYLHALPRPGESLAWRWKIRPMQQPIGALTARDKDQAFRLFLRSNNGFLLPELSIPALPCFSGFPPVNSFLLSQLFAFVIRSSYRLSASCSTSEQPTFVCVNVITAVCPPGANVSVNYDRHGSMKIDEKILALGL